MKKLVGIFLVITGVFIMSSKKRQRQRLTTFGGRDDLYDRGYNSAYLPPKGGKTPSQWYADLPTWAKNLMVPEMANLTQWDKDYCWVYPAGQVSKKRKVFKELGTSAYLDTRQFYIALDTPKHMVKYARKGQLFVRFDSNPGGSPIYAPVVDHGFSGYEHPIMDVSPALHDALKKQWPVPYEVLTLL